MAATESSMLMLGSVSAEFNLPDVANVNVEVKREDFIGRPLLVFFICNHCPFVIHLIEQLTALANDFQQRGFGVVAISSNDIQAYPQDGPSAMRDFATQHGFEFPYCYDETQQVARDFQATCTPDFFVYDQAHRLCYRGQMDDSRPSNDLPVTGADLSTAMLAVLAGQAPDQQQTASIGCSIKWLPETY